MVRHQERNIQSCQAVNGVSTLAVKDEGGTVRRHIYNICSVRIKQYFQKFQIVVRVH